MISLFKITQNLTKMSQDSGSSQVHSPPSQSRDPIGKERYGAGDTYLVQGVLPQQELEGAFERLREEVQWCTMSHRGTSGITCMSR